MTVTDLKRLDNLEVWLKKLPCDERFILAARFGLNGRKPMTLDEVGTYLLVSRERVRQLQNIALSKLRRALAKELQEEGVRVHDLPSSETISRAWDKGIKSKELPRGVQSIEGVPPKPRYIAWADRAIRALQGFKRGRIMQMCHSDSRNWFDFDLCHHIDAGMIEWRVRPIENSNRPQLETSNNGNSDS